MRRPILALIQASLAAVALVVVMTIGSSTASRHGDHVAVPAGSTTGTGSTTVPVSTAAAQPLSTAADASLDHAEHLAAAGGSVLSSALGSTPAAAATLAPDGDPAGRRQIGLGEAAGAPPVVDLAVSADIPGSASGWIDPQAAGVNDGTKKQAESVPLEPAPVVAPAALLPGNGQVSGCVTGYGRGAVCLPQTPPSHAGHGQAGGEDLSKYWTCSEVRTLLPDGITVDSPASDVLGLDGNRDGTACGPGDE